MAPLLLAAAGVAALIAAGLILRTFGAGYRIGRLLATTPKVSIAEANRLASAGRHAYVRVDGRIAAEDDFEDEHRRPLVFRRVRLESRTGGVWRPFEDHRQAVPFAIQEGLDAITIDVDALDEGLIVIPRESVGAAEDVAERAPAGIPAGMEVRVRIDQVSSVEHAIVIGYPVAVGVASTGDHGAGRRAVDDHATAMVVAPIETAGATPPTTPIRTPGVDPPPARMTSGRGRPLILTVLEPDEAMRILAAEGPQRTRAAALLLLAGVALLLGAAAWAGLTAILPALVAIVPGSEGWITAALGATPLPSAAEGGDPRSNGQGPGLVGTPGLAILGVVAIAVVAVILTTAYVRLTGGSTTRAASRPGARAGPSGRGRRRH